MTEPTEREIKARAYQLWERAGRPENREDEFWHAAQQGKRCSAVTFQMMA
jgi:hypothetical protein